MGKTLRQRNRKHNKSKKTKKGGSLSLDSNKPGKMKDFRTRTRRSSSPKPTRKPKTLDKQRTQILCMRFLRNGIKTGNQWEEFLRCKDVNLDDIVEKYPTGESWKAELDDMNRGRVERQHMIDNV